MVRKCPSCGKSIEYKGLHAFKNACKNDSKCKTCTAISNSRKMHADISNGLRKNPFFGKSHSDETKKKISEKSIFARKEGRVDTRGEKNGMYGRHLPSEKKGKSFIEMYGPERAEQLKQNMSKNSSGKNNPMYGKPSPTGSGNGWSGYYNDYYFRSLLELSFIINMTERFNFEVNSAESIRIKYSIQNIDRTYVPDFLVNNKYLVEIKPKKLVNSKVVTLKRNAAIQYCEQNNLVYKLISPQIIDFSLFKELVESGKVKLLERYHIKFKNLCH